MIECGLPMTRAEFEMILADDTKTIAEDIGWSDDEDHSPWIEFRKDILSETAYPMFVHGAYNRLIGKLRFSIIHKGSGRIYGLCMGSDHHNPSCLHVGGDRHLHSWNDITRDKDAVDADQITVAVTDPVGVWRQFCLQFHLGHQGTMEDPMGILRLLEEF